MTYDYRMIPFQGAGSGKSNAWQEAADQLRNLVLQAQSQGWEFLSVQHTTHYERPGCFAALFGAGPILRQVDIVVFRRPMR